MAALFYIADNTDTRGIFRGGFPVNTMIDIPELRTLFGELGANLYTVITEVSVENNETIQFFLTFDDVIKYFFFGKGLGNININGIIFTDCYGNAPGLPNYFTTIGNLRGKELKISIPPIGFKAVITNHRLNILTEPNMMAEFQLNLAITEHVNMPQPQFTPVC